MRGLAPDPLEVNAPPLSRMRGLAPIYARLSVCSSFWSPPSRPLSNATCAKQPPPRPCEDACSRALRRLPLLHTLLAAACAPFWLPDAPLICRL